MFYVKLNAQEHFEIHILKIILKIIIAETRSSVQFNFCIPSVFIV